MRAHEIFESDILESGQPKIDALGMARHVLVPQYGFKEYTPDRMFIKYISKSYYIAFQCGLGTATLGLFNRNTMKTDDKLFLSGGNNNGPFIGFKEKHQILNKITDWARQFSDTDPQIEGN